MPLFKRDPRKKLQKSYHQKLEAAMHAMRNGDIRTNAELTAEAEAIKAQLDQLG
ncbi:MAG: Lacal_2735 family protein [Gammaproteobacteria bacterium]|nr:Lacal_2735 family protein [Gammaproteobacteria bacterium]